MTIDVDNIYEQSWIHQHTRNLIYIKYRVSIKKNFFWEESKKTKGIWEYIKTLNDILFEINGIL